ncbi:hypothetical protein DYH09_30365 [bacterium CPR1]|nr:hypothetical protein [bacterium CPR1]
MQEIGRLGPLPQPSSPSAAPPPAPSSDPRETVTLRGTVSEPLQQALVLAEMHAKIPAEYLTPEQAPGPAEPFREEARKLLSNPTERQVEVTALTLFEQSLAAAPRTLVVIPGPTSGVPPGKGLAESGLYTAKLAAALGGGAFALSPAMITVLEDFQADKIWTPVYYQGSASQYRAAGHLDEVRLAHLVTSPPLETEQGIRMRGILSPEEAAHIEIAIAEMERKIPGSSDSFHTVHVRTLLGEGQDPATGVAYGGVAGLAGAMEEIGLSREVARNLDSCRETLFHEAGHEIDRKLGQKVGLHYGSVHPDSPFGKTSDPTDYVSSYAQAFCWEDLAETHRVLLGQHDSITAHPDLFIHANGKVGQKLAWLLEKGYGQTVPPPCERTLQALERAEEADSPFGWETPEGGKVGAQADLQRTLRGMLAMWDPRQTPPPFLGIGPEGTKHRFIARELMGVELPEPPPMPVGGMGGGFSPCGGGFANAPVMLDAEQSLESLKESLQRLARAPEELDVSLAETRAALEEARAGGASQARLLSLQATLEMIQAERFRLGVQPLTGKRVATGEEANLLLVRYAPPERLVELTVPSGELAADRRSRLAGQLSEVTMDLGRACSDLMGASLRENGGQPVPLLPVQERFFASQHERTQHSFRLGHQLAIGGQTLELALQERLEPGLVGLLETIRPGFTAVARPVSGPLSIQGGRGSSRMSAP